MRAIVPGSALGALVAVLGIALAPTAADAHAAFVTSMPAPDSTVAAPAAVTIIFSQAVSRTGTRITVSGPAGVVSGATSVNDRTASVPLQGVGPGVYTVQWSNVSLEDGHEAADAFHFTVAGQPAAQPAPAPGRTVPTVPASGGTAQRLPTAPATVPLQASTMPRTGTGMMADAHPAPLWVVTPAILAALLVVGGVRRAKQRKE